jgi:hypothetical protein
LQLSRGETSVSCLSRLVDLTREASLENLPELAGLGF